MAREIPQPGGVHALGGFWNLRALDLEIDARSFPAVLSPTLRGTAPDGSAARFDQNTWAPQSEMTMVDFVEKMFVPEHVALMRLSGRTHYQAILKHVLTPEEVDRVFNVRPGESRRKLKAVPGWPYLSGARLRDVRPEDVQRLVSAASGHGYSTQTVKHIRNVVSVIFAHARKKLWFTGENPASLVTLPAMTRKEAHSLTLDQAIQLLSVMRYPEKEMMLVAILTSLNVAEICGLQWKRVNMTEEWCDVDGEAIPPRTIAVRKQWYLGELASVKKKSRNRNLPIPEPLCPILLGLSRRPKFTGPDDFVLASRVGTPVNENSVAARRLRPIGKTLDMPWLSWQVLRRTHTALIYELGVQFLDRMAMISECRPSLDRAVSSDSASA